jgi:5-methylthioadenosine/S-adenosylhomocysteine deaminase
MLNFSNKTSEADREYTMYYDMKLQGHAVLTMNTSREILQDGVILIRDGIIQELGPAKNFDTVEAKKYMAYPHGLIMPGLINTHTHLPMSCFRGLADDLPLMRWLEDFIFPAELRFMDAQTAYWGSLLSLAEMALSGTTCCADGYFLEHHVGLAVEKSGLRAVLAQGIIDFPAPGVPDPAENVNAASRFILEWQGRSPRIQPALFCHSIITCSSQTLVRGKALGKSLGSLFFIHLAETRAEINTIMQQHGTTPTAYLDSLGILDPHTVGVHCIWLNEQDMAVMSRQGVKVSHTPESEMKLASGVTPVADLIQHGVITSLGTDGCASNNDLDMFQEMDMAAKLQKVHRLDSTVLPAGTVVWMSTMGGALALGLEEQIGSLEKGKRADVIILNLRKPHLVPLYDYYSHLVYSAKGSDVQSVLVDGEVIVEDGVLTRLDLDEIMDQGIRIGLRVREG